MTSNAEVMTRIEISDPERLVRDPLVSVVMITYNHERFIAQAIEGVLKQQTEFGVELIIGEDCSTDATRQFVLEFQKKYPEVIRVLIGEKNIGAHENFLSVYEATRGKYIAFCEGDDYWISPDKLCKQVEVLEHNLQVSLCFHSQHVFNDGIIDFVETITKPRDENLYTLEDIIISNFIPNASSVHRKLSLSDYRLLTDGNIMGDWFFHIMCARKGYLCFVDGLYSAYRMHDGGIWSRIANDKKCINIISAYHSIDKYTNYEYHRLVCSMLCKFYYRITNAYIAKEEYFSAIRASLYMLRYLHHDSAVKTISYVSRKNYLKAIIKPYLHPFYKYVRRYILRKAL